MHSCLFTVGETEAGEHRHLPEIMLGAIVAAGVSPDPPVLFFPLWQGNWMILDWHWQLLSMEMPSTLWVWGQQLTVDLEWWRQLRASEPQVCHLGCPGNIAVLN